MIDQLAADYANQSVVFLEYNVDDTRYNSRIGRWFTASGGSSATLPLAMVDSGQQFTQGMVTYNGFKAMVDTSLARPPQAEITAYWQRTGNRVHFTVWVKNLSGTTLNSTNSASVWVIAYEDAHAQLTNRFVRGIGSQAITSLAHNASATYTLDTGDLDVGVDWNKLHFIALVEYRPGGSTGAYDMLQAALASPPASAAPDVLTFLVDTADTTMPVYPLTISGPGGMSWNAVPSHGWLTVTPSSSTLPVQPQVSVVKGLLAPGWQTGSVSLTSPDGALNDSVQVNVYLGAVKRLYLPVVRR